MFLFLGCEHNGNFFNDGDRIPNAESPCYSCYCQGSSITCALADCKFRFDCEPEYVAGECCPRYDHCPPEPSSTTRFTTRLTHPPPTKPTTTATQKPELPTTKASQITELPTTPASHKSELVTTTVSQKTELPTTTSTRLPEFSSTESKPSTVLPPQNDTITSSVELSPETTSPSSPLKSPPLPDTTLHISDTSSADVLSSSSDKMSEASSQSISLSTQELSTIEPLIKLSTLSTESSEITETITESSLKDSSIEMSSNDLSTERSESKITLPSTSDSPIESTTLQPQYSSTEGLLKETYLTDQSTRVMEDTTHEAITSTEEDNRIKIMDEYSTSSVIDIIKSTINPIIFSIIKDDEPVQPAEIASTETIISTTDSTDRITDEVNNKETVNNSVDDSRISEVTDKSVTDQEVIKKEESVEYESENKSLVTTEPNLPDLITDRTTNFISEDTFKTTINWIPDSGLEAEHKESANDNVIIAGSDDDLTITTTAINLNILNEELTDSETPILKDNLTKSKRNETNLTELTTPKSLENKELANITIKLVEDITEEPERNLEMDDKISTTLSSIELGTEINIEDMTNTATGSPYS